MITLVLRWAAIVIAVFLVAWGLPQIFPEADPLITYNDWVPLAIFAVVLALLNTFIRPIVQLLTLPLSCLTFGLFGIVINVLMFVLADYLVEGFDVGGFWGALVGAIAVSVVSALVNMLTGSR